MNNVFPPLALVDRNANKPALRKRSRSGVLDTDVFVPIVAYGVQYRGKDKIPIWGI